MVSCGRLLGVNVLSNYSPTNLPMHDITHHREQESSGLYEQCCPKPSTIDFIKQFARAYSFNALLPAALGTFIAN